MREYENGSGNTHEYRGIRTREREENRFNENGFRQSDFNTDAPRRNMSAQRKSAGERSRGQRGADLNGRNTGYGRHGSDVYGSGNNNPGHVGTEKRRGSTGKGGRGGRGGRQKLLAAVFVFVLACVIIFAVYGAVKNRKGNTAESGNDATAESQAALTDNSLAITDEYGNIIRSEADIEADSSLSEAEKKLLEIKSSLESGNSVMSTLRKYYPDDLILYKNKRYVFTPVSNDLKRHSYSADNLKQLEDGEWQYTDGDKVVSHKGIDVSSHQGDIDWAKVGASNVEFAMIRALYRGYTSGKLVEDEKFKDNIQGANDNGIKAGIYVFTQALSNEEVDEEISMLKDLIGENKVSYPVVVDIEEANAGEGRMDTLGKAERTKLVKYYCEEIKKAGYTPMIYLNIDSALLMLDLSGLEDYDKWFATYNSDFYYPYMYTLWQYSDSGSIDGIEGNVDLDISFADY